MSSGSEFYLEQWPALVGKTFGEISFMFRDAVPIGLRRASENMKVELNPPDGLLFGAGDELVVRALVVQKELGGRLLALLWN